MVNEAFFYADNGMVESTDLVWIQLAFDTLTGLFDRLGMQTNVCKTVGMVYRRCRSAGVRADEAYTRRMTGEGQSFRDRHQERLL